MPVEGGEYQAYGLGASIDRGEVASQLDHAARLRPAVEGDPSQGPYPATITEVAAEVVAWINRMEETSARGLRTAVIARLVRDLQR